MRNFPKLSISPEHPIVQTVQYEDLYYIYLVLECCFGLQSFFYIESKTITLKYSVKNIGGPQIQANYRRTSYPL